MEPVRSPRAVFVDYPVGRTFGRPGAPDEHRRVLRDALAELPRFGQSGEIRDLPYSWTGDDRSWEEWVRDEILSYGRK